MTITAALAKFPLKTEAEARAARAAQSEGNALQAAVDLSRDLTALIVRAQALQKVATMPAEVAERLDDLIAAADDCNIEVAVERYEADAPRRERGALDYAREVAADLRSDR